MLSIDNNKNGTKKEKNKKKNYIYLSFNFFFFFLLFFLRCKTFFNSDVTVHFLHLHICAGVSCCCCLTLIVSRKRKDERIKKENFSSFYFDLIFFFLYVYSISNRRDLSISLAAGRCIKQKYTFTYRSDQIAKKSVCYFFSLSFSLHS